MEVQGRTIREWYNRSRGGTRGKFLSEIASLDCAALIAQLQRECLIPPAGRMRTRTELDACGRKAAPTVQTLQADACDEQTLQWMFLHRGYLLAPIERVLRRELPTCCAGQMPIGWADLLAFDTECMQPILVELKRAEANDPLSAVVLELLSHWVFQVRHIGCFNALIGDYGYAARLPMRLVIGAPEAYFREARAVSQRRRAGLRGEYEIALSWIKGLRSAGAAALDLYAIEEQWQASGPAFRMRRLPV